MGAPLSWAAANPPVSRTRDAFCFEPGLVSCQSGRAGDQSRRLGLPGCRFHLRNPAFAVRVADGQVGFAAELIVGAHQYARDGRGHWSDVFAAFDGSEAFALLDFL